MKLKMFILSLLSTVMLVACGGNEEVEKEEVVSIPEVKTEGTVEAEVKPEVKEEEIEEHLTLDLFADDPVPEKGGVINVEQVKAIIEYHGLRANDKLVDVTLNNGEINATVEVTGANGLPASMSAEGVYAGSGDELLKHEGWDVLTINFGEGIGKVSMNRSQQRDDGFGPYFPTAEIINQLEGN